MTSISNSNIPRRSTLEIEEGVEVALLSAEVELNPRPPLLIKVTGYRLLTISVVASFGTAKAFKSLEGSEVTATWIDWILGVILSTALYWLGLYECLQPPVAVWFFHMDLTQDLFYLLFGVVIATIYCVLACLGCIFLMQLSVIFIAWLALPYPKHDKFTPVAGMFFGLSLIILSTSIFAALFLPLLVGRVIVYVIGLLLTSLGCGRFKRKVTKIFVAGYITRFDEWPEVYVIATLLTSLVICVVVVPNLPLTKWLQTMQSMFW